MKELKLTNSDMVAIVDDEDYDMVRNYKWYLSPNGYVHSTRERKKLHRLIMGLDDSVLEVDHINNDRLDNRKNNLRVCNHTDNLYNRDTKGRTGYKGVTNGAHKYNVTICKDHKRIHGGCYETPEMAAMRFNFLAMQLHGEYAKYNDLPDFNQVKDFLIAVKDKVKITAVNGIDFQIK